MALEHSTYASGHGKGNENGEKKTKQRKSKGVSQRENIRYIQLQIKVILNVKIKEKVREQVKENYTALERSTYGESHEKRKQNESTSMSRRGKRPRETEARKMGR